MPVRVRLLVLAVFALFLPSTSAAQDTAPASGVRAAGPLLETTATAFRASAQLSDSLSTSMQQRQNVRRPVALIIVGGAAVVIGGVIGGDAGLLFMIGGAVALLYGLYHYLQ